MTDQLDGRDLDIACGEAMGWTDITDGARLDEALAKLGVGP